MTRMKAMVNLRPGRPQWRSGTIHSLVTLFVLLAASISVATAHPMGNFSVNHYSSISVQDGELAIRYRLDFAEIPTAQEMPSIDTDGDHQISDAERAAYFAKRIPQLVAGLELRLDDQPAALNLAASELRVRPGAANLPTLFVTLDFRVPLPPHSIGTRFRVDFRDVNYDQTMGWREITFRNLPGFQVVESNLPGGDRSQALEKYPETADVVPPRQREAHLTFLVVDPNAPTTAPSLMPGAPPPSPAGPVSAGSAAADRNTSTPQDRLTSLITTKDFSFGFLLLALGVAFTLGSFHALAPGHGKTVVAAYLVGSRGKARHAVLLGLVVTLTHVAGVFLLGLAVLFASKYVLPERLYPWLGFGSGFLIVALGVWQFSHRMALVYVRRRGLKPPVAGHVHGPGGHTHEMPDRITASGLVALGVSGGMVPCPSALVVMLASIALHRVAFGLLLIVTFSFGLAMVLIVIGLLMLYARRLLERFKWRAVGVMGRIMPLASPLLVASLGVLIAAQAIIAGGVLRDEGSPQKISQTANGSLIGQGGAGAGR